MDLAPALEMFPCDIEQQLRQSQIRVLHACSNQYSGVVTSPSSSSESDDVLKHVPSIPDQLKDWKHDLTETDADRSFYHEHWNSDLRLFNSGEDRAYHLLQLLLIRTELEIQHLPGGTVQALQSLDLIKSRMKKIFQGCIEGIHQNTSRAAYVLPNYFTAIVQFSVTTAKIKGAYGT
ncbi:uncharacterized protein LOC123450002 [Hordeum vulgare subsp. vulgare]|uniref:uncharacterized protein LOC123450002 n=1 Tax=Hordeum vulgare subsp. vulgare TaxID=112509 RepID=UPI001D1A4661|nr:uncharacterized protein LOC123450002 [Hordeum vulgare subsp. vulgare]